LDFFNSRPRETDLGLKLFEGDFLFVDKFIYLNISKLELTELSSDEKLYVKLFQLLDIIWFICNLFGSISLLNPLHPNMQIKTLSKIIQILYINHIFN
jgi:hypothetical protein